jgi:outer membrane protein insertion porin family
VTDLLRRYYREQGYLAAEIDRPRYEYVGATARVLIPVREGPRFTVGRVSAEGNHALDNDALLQQSPLTSGAPFQPSSAEQSLDRIRHAYWQRGYNTVRSDYELRLDEAAGRVDVTFTVEEGPQSVIADIAVEGHQVTSERLVREQIELETSEPLDLSLLARSRRNLYDTGAFSIVDITREELSGDVPAAVDAAVDARATEQVPVRLNVSVREVQPFQVRYGASYDTERGVGGILEVSNRNSLGKARVLGVQSRYDRQLRDARFYLSQPMLRYFPLRTTASLYYREELNPPTEITDAFDISRKGVSIQQEVELRDAYVLSYGYRYERAQTIQPFQPAETQALTVSPMTSTLTRDTRDEVLDASTGSFLSQAVAYSPGWLGSDLPFLKYYGQYFYYVPLWTPPEKPLTGELERARWVFATGVRVGLARGLGGEVPPSERFYAGGSTTLRGFAQNAVGPIGLGRVPTGGNAVLVLNNELRVPLVSMVDGVVFADLGNVFDKVSDFSLSDLRRSGGVGLRVRTPWFLLRGDYGLVFDRRPGERRSRFYFSIGQAF